MLKLSCGFCLVDVDKKEVVRNHSCEEYFLFGGGREWGIYLAFFSPLGDSKEYLGDLHFAVKTCSVGSESSD